MTVDITPVICISFFHLEFLQIPSDCDIIEVHSSGSDSDETLAPCEFEEPEVSDNNFF